ncbi:hypothetical protein Sru01_49370 [Sphaerisporangium rufum]|uniref:Uncharacterized protein n=1 Tax=Sphaerisporangium rufum TaxID=1381558 RepID=A0A919R9T1_9ACTN|nr:hypothetical protein [Sphaerisporangium rufum]GII79955.1 hypothetical protein Sru01_49370 [Sphaerisporangium rufum]
MARRTATAPSAPTRPGTSPPRRPVAGYAIAILLTLVVAGPIGYLLGRPDATQAAIADLRAADARRDVQQIAELTKTARTTADELKPVLAGLYAVFPKAGTASAGPGGPARFDDWRPVLRRAAERHADNPSGTTATNLARSAFRTAVDALAAAIDTYASAEKLPADSRRALEEVAGRQRSAAVAMWSVAATQLDQINVDAGHGHQHVYLTDAEGEHAMTEDDVPEGRE